MSRDLSASMAAGIVAPVVKPILLFDGTLADGTVVRYWSGYGTIGWNGNNYLGSGQLLTIGEVDETDDIKAQGTDIMVNGVPLDMVSLVTASLANGNRGVVRLALLDDSLPIPLIVDTPKVLFAGKLDGATEDEGDVENPVFRLTYEHALADLERPREIRYTHEAQMALYPGDLGLQFIAQLQDQVIEFGKGWMVSK